MKNLKCGKEFEESYDKLLLSPGAKPSKPNLKGIESNKIFTLRTVENTLKLKQYINKKMQKSAVIVGGGFIGIEVAENLNKLGINITLLEASKQLLSPFDSDMVSFIHSEICKNNINLMLNSMVLL